MKFSLYIAVIGAAYGWDYDSKVEVKYSQDEVDRMAKVTNDFVNKEVQKPEFQEFAGALAEAD